jgi:Fur family ferric uptake transcriptional regulator
VPTRTEPQERSTRQRRAIRHVFETADRPLSPDEVLAAVKREGAGGSAATVYRSIRTLVADGYLASVELPGGGAFYEIAGKKHHHHFSCGRCGRVYELDGCLSPESFTLPRGFKAVAHDLTVFGTCRSCR